MRPLHPTFSDPFSVFLSTFPLSQKPSLLQMYHATCALFLLSHIKACHFSIITVELMHYQIPQTSYPVLEQTHQAKLNPTTTVHIGTLYQFTTLNHSTLIKTCREVYSRGCTIHL
jgi:hypothetical protein